MRSPLAVLRRLSLRVRITLSFVAAAALLTMVLSVATFVAVRAFLDGQRVRSSIRQTIFTLTFARDFLGSDPGRSRELVSLLQSREALDALVTEGDRWFSTSLSLTPRDIPGDLASEVLREQVAYQYETIGGNHVLIYGAPLPPAMTNLYLFYSLSDIDRTMSLLARVLAVAGIAVVVAAALLAQPVARRILRPLAGVSTAAQRVAEGLLETRVEASLSDEVGLLAASFNQMAAALQDMIQRERRFVAAVSHELRTPLAALHTTSELLAARADRLPPDLREPADLLVEDVRNLRRLVEELLEVSELGSRRATLRWEEVDLRALVAAVIRRRRADVPVDGPAVRTWADKARVERIVGNLIDNALHHGQGKDVAVSVAVTDGQCEVTVADHGPGIAPQDLPHLFERFYKADRSRTRGGGIGLGLGIAMENAKLLGGTIEPSNRPEGGATFVFRLPLLDAGPESGR